MLVSINSIAITPEEIRITATNLEAILLSDDLYSRIEDEEAATFVFPASSLRDKKYIFKLCHSQRQARDKKSLGEMAEALKGCVLSISDGFLER